MKHIQVSAVLRPFSYMYFVSGYAFVHPYDHNKPIRVCTYSCCRSVIECHSDQVIHVHIHVSRKCFVLLRLRLNLSAEGLGFFCGVMNLTPLLVIIILHDCMVYLQHTNFYFHF